MKVRVTSVGGRTRGKFLLDKSIEAEYRLPILSLRTAGEVAQLGEQCLRKAEVGSSNLLFSTKTKKISPLRGLFLCSKFVENALKPAIHAGFPISDQIHRPPLPISIQIYPRFKKCSLVCSTDGTRRQGSKNRTARAPENPDFMRVSAHFS